MHPRLLPITALTVLALAGGGLVLMNESGTLPAVATAPDASTVETRAAAEGLAPAIASEPIASGSGGASAAAPVEPASPEATTVVPPGPPAREVAAPEPPASAPSPSPPSPRPARIRLAPSVATPWATPWPSEPDAPAGPVLAYAPNPPVAPQTPAIDAPMPPVRPAGLGVRPTSPADAPLSAAPAPPGDFKKGSAAFVRIFKKEGQLELWLKKDGRFALFKTYAVCKWSGVLGPKQKQADYQSPEGFYAVTAKQLKPDSAYHRAFNLGYPNAFDKQLGRTGGLIMVHGDCKSVGCFAMTNAGVEEIYSYVEAALRGGQREMPVHVFPFRMSEGAIARESPSGFASLFGGAQNNWGDFWRNLKEGYDLFERTGEPPVAYACNGRYAFGAAGQSCTRIAGW